MSVSAMSISSSTSVTGTLGGEVVGVAGEQVPEAGADDRRRGRRCGRAPARPSAYGPRAPPRRDPRAAGARASAVGGGVHRPRLERASSSASCRSCADQARSAVRYWLDGRVGHRQQDVEGALAARAAARSRAPASPPAGRGHRCARARRAPGAPTRRTAGRRPRAASRARGRSSARSATRSWRRCRRRRRAPSAATSASPVASTSRIRSRFWSTRTPMTSTWSRSWSSSAENAVAQRSARAGTAQPNRPVT